MRVEVYFVALGLFFGLAACKPKPTETIIVEEETLPETDLSSLGKPKLSEYGFFKGELKNLDPANGILPYTLNSALFSDYAFKKRFISIPAGYKAKYSSNDVFEFPEGTVLIKNFYYPADFRKPDENIRIIETRLLVKEKMEWKTLPYVWNDEQTDAVLEVAGSVKSVQWLDTEGAIKTVNYSIPNTNQCRGCHLRSDHSIPIGPSARQLNRDNTYPEGTKNQLVYWKEKNILDGLPANSHWPKLVSYDDPHASIESRARAWLEVNCAHCHRSDGPARNSGLHLLADISNPAELGVGKAPIAAGKGTGGRLFGIVPGKPEESILQYRIESTDPGIMMPEMGRKLRHEEGVVLVREWIRAMR